MAIERVRQLVVQLKDDFNQLAYYHQLLDLASNFDEVTNIVLLLDAYLPIGKCQLEEIEASLQQLGEELQRKNNRQPS